MPRTLLTRSELIGWLSDELQKVEDCQKCSITQIMSLQHPDEDGCNWSSDPLYLSCADDISAEYVWPYLNRIVIEAKSRFNIKP